MGRDGGPHPGPGLGHETGRVGGGDVLENHLQIRMPGQQGQQHPVDESFFPVENIHSRIGDLPVDQQGQPRFRHGRQSGVATAQIGHHGVRIGGGPCGIKFDRLDAAGRQRPMNLFRRRVVRQIKGHQGLKAGARRQGRQNALPIGQGLIHRGHRGLQVGHDDGPAELAGGMGQHGGQGGAVPQVQVPIVGAKQGEFHGKVPSAVRTGDHCPARQEISTVAVREGQPETRRTAGKRPGPPPPALPPELGPDSSHFSWPGREHKGHF